MCEEVKSLYARLEQIEINKSKTSKERYLSDLKELYNDWINLLMKSEICQEVNEIGEKIEFALCLN